MMEGKARAASGSRWEGEDSSWVPMGRQRQLLGHDGKARAPPGSRREGEGASWVTEGRRGQLGE